MAGGPTIYWVDGFVGAIPAPGEKRGATVERTISYMPQVQGGARKAATRAAGRARGNLWLHQKKYPGESTSIGLQQGRLDWGVHLYSTRGVVAATAIEYGHTGTGAGGRVAPFQVQGKRYPGLFILHRAFGLRKG